jgi:hypothetical protein
VFLFTEHHIELIRLGQKTQTRRVGKTWRAKVGSIHQCRTTLFGPALCHIIIRRRWEERLGDISEKDAWDEGGYEANEYMFGFMEMHAKRHVNLDTVVKCYEFQYIDPVRGPKFKVLEG